MAALRSPSLQRPLPLIGLALLSFSAVAWFIRGQVPWPESYDVRSKVEAFEEVRQEVEAVLIGSSQVYRSFAPVAIEAELEKRGHKLNCFNLGMPGMGNFETDSALHDLLAEPTPKLRYVFIELYTWSPSFAEANSFAERPLFWHDTRSTLLTINSLDYAPAKARMRFLRSHLEHWLWRMTNYGSGPSISKALLPDLWDQPAEDDASKARDMRAKLSASKGYLALEDEDGDEIIKRHESLQEKQSVFKKKVTDLVLSEKKRGSLDKYNIEALARQVRFVEATGAQIIFLIPPGSTLTNDAELLLARGHIPDLVNYARPSRFPFIVKMDWRFDLNHLNREGAERMSRQFAIDLAQRLDRDASEAKGDVAD